MNRSDSNLVLIWLCFSIKFDHICTKSMRFIKFVQIKIDISMWRIHSLLDKMIGKYVIYALAQFVIWMSIQNNPRWKTLLNYNSKQIMGNSLDFSDGICSSKSLQTLLSQRITKKKKMKRRHKCEWGFVDARLFDIIRNDWYHKWRRRRRRRLYIYFSANFHEEFVKVFKRSILRCLGLHAIDDVVRLRFQCVTLCRQSFVPFHDYLKPLSEDIYWNWCWKCKLSIQILSEHFNVFILFQIKALNRLESFIFRMSYATTFNFTLLSRDLK